MYSFPTIKHIDDVLPHIKDKSEFVVVKKDFEIFIDYKFQDSNTFGECETLSERIRLECRGLTFDNETGKLVRRPYHKFFNYGEKSFHKNKPVLDLADWHVLEKLDGSMIAPVIINRSRNIVCWYTKNGYCETESEYSDIGYQITSWLKTQHPSLEDMYVGLINRFWPEYTVIFEWCSPENQIVVKYPEERLVLTAIRHNQTGEYLRYHELPEVPGIPVVKAYDCYNNFEQMLDVVSKLEDSEGVVLRHKISGHMIKIKADLYCSLHRAVSSVSGDPRHLAKLYFTDKLDDVIGNLPERLAIEAERQSNEYSQVLQRNIGKILSDIDDIQSNNLTRKDYALKTYGQCPNRALIFVHWDNLDYLRQNVRELLKEYITKYTNSNSSWYHFYKKL